MAEDDDEPIPTYEHAIVPWVRIKGAMAPKVLHLIVGHFERAEELLGCAAPVDRPCWLGRGGSQPGDHGQPIKFQRDRPGGPLGVIAHQDGEHLAQAVELHARR